jgi:16S rRNA G966 N2-methylase RsmD
VLQAYTLKSRYFANLLNNSSKKKIPTHPKIYLFEYDSRFERLVTKPDGFVNYDYNNPLRIPAALRGKVDRVLADPPFLSDECLTRTAMSVRSLLKKEEGRTMVCTGQKMEDMVPRLFPGVRKVEFEPKHKGGLANAFACFMDWKGKDI